MKTRGPTTEFNGSFICNCLIMATPTGDIIITDQISLSCFVDGHTMTTSAKQFAF